MATLIEIHEVNTGELISCQRISDDAGSFQRESLAYKLMAATTFAFEDMYCAVVDAATGDALGKFQVQESLWTKS